MSAKSKTPDVNVKPAELECPHCGRSDWFRFVEVCSTFFGPAEVAVMPHGISITVPRSDEKRYSEENPRLKCNICGCVLWVDDIIPEARAMTSSARHERDLNVFNELKGVLVDGCSLEIADLLTEALELLEVPGVAFLWDFADPNSGLAHGWHLVRQVGNEWYYLSDDIFDFLQGSGDGPGEVSSVGRKSDLISGPAVRGTRASFTVN